MTVSPVIESLCISQNSLYFAESDIKGRNGLKVDHTEFRMKLKLSKIFDDGKNRKLYEIEQDEMKRFCIEWW